VTYSKCETQSVRPVDKTVMHIFLTNTNFLELLNFMKLKTCVKDICNISLLSNILIGAML